MIWKKNDWARELGRIVTKYGAVDFSARGEDLDNERDYEPFVGVIFPKGTPESESQEKLAEMRREAREVTGIVFQLLRSKIEGKTGTTI